MTKRGLPKPAWTRLPGDPLELLNSRAVALADAGTPTPCNDDARFTSEDPDVRAQVAPLCRDCPLLTDCESAASWLRPTAGVWAGSSWTGDNAKEARRSA